jgi:2'-5' RNA ligase
LTGKLIAAGFALEKRRYSPHVTLGREVKTGAMPESIEPFGETVTSIDLMKSERISGKLTYTAIYTKK